MPTVAGSEPRRLAISLWRAVEAQHVVATRLLVDSREEQRLLEDLLDPGKPAVPAEARDLHYLLFTPFRYPPTALGSRFRRPADPGVFYGADLIRTACAELGYWRWRFLVDSPALESISPAAQTLFRVAASGRGIDLREPPWSKDTARWTDPADYGPCQQLAATARRVGVTIIRYQSVRDPESGGAAAVLDPGAFTAPEPLERETWHLGVTRDRVWWVRDRLHGPDAGFDFPMARWRDLPNDRR